MSRKAETVSRLVELYKELISRPTPVSGRIVPTDVSFLNIISSVWNQRSLERGQLVKTQSTDQVNFNEKLVRNLATAEVNEQMSSWSASELLRCVVRQITDNAGKKKQFLEVWEGGRLWKNFDVAAFDLHGDIYTDGEFGCLQWDASERQILYVAEKKKPKTEPFYKQGAKKASPDGDEDQPTQGEEYVYVEEWGEQLVGKSQSVVAVCDLEEGILKLIPGVPDMYSPGQLIWNKAGNGIYGLGVQNTPRRLGLIYCTSVPGVIFQLSLTGDFSVLTSEGVSPRSARLSPDGKTLIWLQRISGGPHDACQQLLKMDIASNKISVVVDIVKEISSGFPGIFSAALPTRCFSQDSSRVVVNTVRKFDDVVFTVDLSSSNSLSELTTGVALDVNNDNVLIITASATQTPNLVLLNLQDGGSSLQVTPSYPLQTPATMFKIDLKAESSTQAAATDFNCMLFKPNGAADKSLPLIVFPHGGPHSVTKDTWMLEPAFFVSLGFAVLLVNYRGSTGSGDDSVDSLPGNVGTMDVQDCQQCVRHVLSQFADLNGDKIVAYGGSHGGFLSLHLAGQFPDVYKAAVVRNPVVDLPAMGTISDIPDWVWVEGGQLYKPDTIPDDAQFIKLEKASPIQYVGNVKAPVLFMIGTNDLRVPCSQSLYIYKILKARGIKTKLHQYSDVHSLATVPVHFDALINSTLWILDSLDHTLPLPQ